MKQKKFSISTFLVSTLGLILFFKAFIYIIEDFVLKTTGSNNLKVDDSDLNLAFIIVTALLVIRISFVMISHHVKRSKNNIIEPENDFSSYVCAACGKPLSEKVRQYCLHHSDKFGGKFYCFDHQK